MNRKKPLTHQEKILAYMGAKWPKYVTVKKIAKVTLVPVPIINRILGQLRDDGKVEHIHVYSSDGWLAFRLMIAW